MRADIGFFILGVVFLLIALTGGRMRHLMSELSKALRSDARFVSALLGIAFIVIAIMVAGRDERPVGNAKSAVQAGAPNPMLEERPGATVFERPPLDSHTPRPPAPSAAATCDREVPVTAAMVTNHASGTQRKLVGAAEMVGAGAAGYAILHNLADGSHALNTTIRVPAGASEFKVAVGYRKTSLCTGGDSTSRVNVAVMGDRSELDSATASGVQARSVAVAVRGLSEIALVTSAKSEPRACASVVWSEPRFVVKLEDRCK